MKIIILGIALFFACIYVLRNGIKIWMMAEEKEIKYKAKQWRKKKSG
jgi:hypothetical protein